MPDSGKRTFRNFAIFCGVALLFLVLVGVWFFRSMESGWESMLAGPFVGQRFDGGVLSPPTSTLAISDSLSLEVHQEPGVSDSMLTLYDSSVKSNRWSRVMTPIRSEMEIPTNVVSEVRLSKANQGPEGYKVRFLCVWTQGGREGGMIYLDRELRFVKFAVSW